MVITLTARAFPRADGHGGSIAAGGLLTVAWAQGRTPCRRLGVGDICLSAMRGLRAGPIERRVKKIALDNSDNHFADELANLHISQPCLHG